MTPTGAETVLYSFGSSATDASEPVNLILGSDGNFYGVSQSGGTAGMGTVFKVTSSGVETLPYSFQGTAFADGAQAWAFLQGGDGNFYGTSLGGGVVSENPQGNGTVVQGDASGSGDRASCVYGCLGLLPP